MRAPIKTSSITEWILYLQEQAQVVRNLPDKDLAKYLHNTLKASAEAMRTEITHARG